MRSWGAGWITALALSIAVAGSAHALGEEASDELPRIGPAPEFTLIDQHGRRVKLLDLRGRVLAITFIFARCADTCPVLTAVMAGLQDRLGAAFGTRVHFVSITLDPRHDTPAVLKRHAKVHRANLSGWSFLTGSPAQVREVATRYGVFFRQTKRDQVDHSFLTSLVDRTGTLRVQYRGVAFDPDEMLHDLTSLSEEAATR